MKKFKYSLVILAIAFLAIIVNQTKAFEPKVSYAKKSLPLFNITGKKLAEIENNNPNDPLILEMKQISRENIKYLPDELDFGILSIDYAPKIESIKRYNIYNFVFEGLELNAGLAIYETLDSISLFPAIKEVGEYVSQVTFLWEEADPETGIFKHYQKTIFIKANVVDESIEKFATNNEIKEIWYNKEGGSSYEESKSYNDNNYRIQGGGTLILPDISDYDNLNKNK